MQFDGNMDRLADKFANLNTGVRKELRKAAIRDSLDQLVLDGRLGYDPETGKYWRLPTEDGEGAED